MTITAEQAAEAAKGLTFEKVWAALMESRERQEKAFAEMKQSSAETDRQLKEARAETDRQLKETFAEMKKIVDRTSRQVGELGGSIGRMTEEMFSAKLWEKFDGIYNFTQGGPRKLRGKNRETIAQVDAFLENGEYAMIVEIKTTLKKDDVDEHLERIETVRRYMDERGDKRKLVGAVAGAVVHDDVCAYAQKHGLYVLAQSGESVVLAEAPSGFKATEW
jgi:hypothetical protein